jgi:hypothetical protein
MSLSKFTGSFLALGHFNIDDTNKKTGAHTDEYQFRLGYKITDDTKVGVLGAFAYNKVGTVSDTAQTDVEHYDSALTATTKAGSLLGSDPLSLDFRIYMPTSRAAAYGPAKTPTLFNDLRSHQVTLRFDTAINYQITPKIAAGVGLSPRHIIREEGANITRIISSPNVTYNFTDALSTYAAINDEFRIASDAKGTMFMHTMGPEVGLNYTATKNLDLAAIVSQDRNVLNPTTTNARAEYSMFYAQETEYQLQGVMHF